MVAFSKPSAEIWSETPAGYNPVKGDIQNWAATVEQALITLSNPPPITVALDGTQYTIPRGEYLMDHVTFNITSNYGTSTPAIRIEDGAKISRLRINVSLAATDVDRIVSLAGNNISIGEIEITAAAQINLHDEQLDGAIQVRGDNCTIGRIRLVNVDRGLSAFQVKGLLIGDFHAKSYSKGIRLEQCDGVRILCMHCEGRSPYATPDPGFNGFSAQDCKNVFVGTCVIENAAEHSIYVSGSDPVSAGSNIAFGNVVSIGSGQCGMKFKSTGGPISSIDVSSLTVIDAAQGSVAGPNEDGLRLENCRGVVVHAFNMRTLELGTSGYAGVHIDGCRDVRIAGSVSRCYGPMIYVTDSRGDNARLSINLDGVSIGSHGLFIEHLNGGNISGSAFSGTWRTIGGNVVRLDGNATMVTNKCIAVVNYTDPELGVFNNNSGDADFVVTATDVGA